LTQVIKAFPHSTMVSWETTVVCPIETKVFDDMLLAARQSKSAAVAEFVHEITKSRTVLDFDGSGCMSREVEVPQWDGCIEMPMNLCCEGY
jgi:hypothetical protein